MQNFKTRAEAAMLGRHAPKQTPAGELQRTCCLGNVREKRGRGGRSDKETWPQTTFPETIKEHCPL